MRASKVMSVYFTRSPEKEEVTRYLEVSGMEGVLSVHYLSNQAQLRQKSQISDQTKLACQPAFDSRAEKDDSLK